MASICVLSYQNQNLELELADELPKIDSTDLSNCQIVYEDGSYEIHFRSDQYTVDEVQSVTVLVNDEEVGVISTNKNTDALEGDVEFRRDIFQKQPFLLKYDWVIIAFIITLTDKTIKRYYTDFLLCVSKTQADANNIQQMIQELITFDDTQIGEWLFFDASKKESAGLYRGSWIKHAYKSIGSYIQLLEQIAACYKRNYAYFRVQAKHTIKHINTLTSYKDVRTLSAKSFDWVMQNAEQLVETSIKTGVEFRGKYYIPYSILTDISRKSFDTYENRTIVGFLYTVISNAKQVYTVLDRDVLNEEDIISKIHGSIPQNYKAPIITLKSLQISYCKSMLEKLENVTDVLQENFRMYQTIFGISNPEPITLPRKTNTFLEVMPYSQVFEVILRWFQYGEYSLKKEELILRVKTLDKIFEYYCLLRLLKMLANHGYQKADIEEPVTKYTYTFADYRYQNERDIANTYRLTNQTTNVTVYYQPVISCREFENGITLYRTTKPWSEDKPDYYTPDFILKFTTQGHSEEYVILDSKFSSRDSIKRHSLESVMLKYSSQCSVAAEVGYPKMVWILQGRVRRGESPIWFYHNSPLANLYHPVTSVGIVSINTENNIEQEFWQEIRKNISFL